ncbi:MAG: hypothetical protein KJZ91_03965, partial [Myxococcales bacterium]|nr:hypothetical protein [Myxococcales bacterium]
AWPRDPRGFVDQGDTKGIEGTRHPRPTGAIQVRATASRSLVAISAWSDAIRAAIPSVDIQARTAGRDQ